LKKERRPRKQFDVSLVQGSEEEEREEWKERRAGHGRGLNNFTDSSPRGISDRQGRMPTNETLRHHTAHKVSTDIDQSKL